MTWLSSISNGRGYQPISQNISDCRDVKAVVKPIFPSLTSLLLARVGLSISLDSSLKAYKIKCMSLLSLSLKEVSLSSFATFSASCFYSFMKTMVQTPSYLGGKVLDQISSTKLYLQNRFKKQSEVNEEKKVFFETYQEFAVEGSEMLQEFLLENIDSSSTLLVGLPIGLAFFLSSYLVKKDSQMMLKHVNDYQNLKEMKSSLSEEEYSSHLKDLRKKFCSDFSDVLLLMSSLAESGVLLSEAFSSKLTLGSMFVEGALTTASTCLSFIGGSIAFAHHGYKIHLLLEKRDHIQKALEKLDAMSLSQESKEFQKELLEKIQSRLNGSIMVHSLGIIAASLAITTGVLLVTGALAAACSTGIGACVIGGMVVVGALFLYVKTKREDNPDPHSLSSLFFNWISCKRTSVKV